MEIVLGIDNIIFISIAANRLPESQQSKARNIGLLLAMVFRIVLLLGLGYLIAMQAPILPFDWGWLKASFTGQSLILFAGGIFLLYKSTNEIHHKLEGASESEESKEGKKTTSLQSAIIQIFLINVVFSFDSILTAVGLTKNISIMIISVVVSILVMMLFARQVGEFINRHPTVQMLGLSFLLLIGFMLIAEGSHLAHIVFLNQEVGAIPKSYLYFAIFFSLMVEYFNIRLRKNYKPSELKQRYEEESI
ncbi:MAG: TerC family protein [Bacteroidetes bacterium]|nr:TerC family protein [Bacteroidota bacterium]